MTAEIKSRLSIVDVVGETVALKKAGTTFKGLCPFHGEKTPSFVVTPARETYHCFGCGKGGDVFSFVMERDGLAFPDALKVLAAKAGVELGERTRRDDARRARQREVLESAIAFYHTVLTASRAGQPALDYLRGRGFSDETIARFQLGWEPGGWDVMSRTLQARRGIRPEELAEVGLTTSRANGRGAYDRFRSRVMFPIRDANGGAVGLGGRVLPGPDDGTDHGPKYLNSPATPLFDKSRTLYLIDRAKAPIRKGGQVVLVEGYTDALMAHQAGFDNVVASLGTALTPGQVAILTRYAKRIALAYDVDPAGQSAGTFGVTELNALISEVQAGDSGIDLTEVGVVRLPEGKDPDEVIRATRQVWRDATARPAPILEFLIDHHASRVDTTTPEGRKRLVDGVLPTLRRVADPVVRDSYVQVLARRSGLDERTLIEAMQRPAQGGSWRPGVGGSSGDGDHAGAKLTLEAVRSARDRMSPDEVVRAVSPVEAELLRLLLLVPDLQVEVVETLAPDQLTSTLARQLYRAVVLQREPDEQGIRGGFDAQRLLDGRDEETAALAVAVMYRDGPDPRELSPERQRYAVENLVLDLEYDRLEARSEFNRAAQAEAER
ncbi:MAG TPA: DNA primase, partial [Candidatus Dormibacteraeota bacterium]|nr:DNA primase [Candidatus Dormibacteraeota bacterium]